MMLLGTLLAGRADAQIFVSSSDMVSEYNFDGTLVNASLITGLNAPFGLALSGNSLYVVNFVNGSVGEYDATSGVAINATLITGLSQAPTVLAVSGSNLYVVNSLPGGVALYNATTGASINPSFITGLSYPAGIAISGNDLYVPSQENLNFGYINKYDATTGAAVSVPLISGLLHAPEGLLVSGNILYQANVTAGTVGTYNATTGAVINASFISGLSNPSQLALLGNRLFVSDRGAGTIGEYDATTGATINASLISGLSPNPWLGLAVREPYVAQVQQPIDPDESSVFNVRRGVVPVKFTLTHGGVATCALPPATIALTRTAGVTIEEIDESVYSGSADSGSNFRINGCQYIYNLSANALGVGTYRVDIKIDNQVVGSATFQLK